MRALDIVKALPLAVVVGDQRGRLTEANPAARVLLGIDTLPDTVEELRRLVGVRDHVSHTAITPDTATFERAARGEGASARHELTNQKTGETRVVDIATAPVRSPEGEIVAVAMALYDVTAIVRAEQQREEFMSIVSHELKTPLTPLKAIAQLIRSRIRRAREASVPPDLEAVEKNLVTIERQVDRMNGLVNDLLEVSRAGRGTFELQPEGFDLARVVREAVQRYIDATDEEGRHIFHVDAPERLTITADQARVEQVLWNLIGNAVKYSPRGGRVDVRLTTAGGAAVIEVTDQGIGIPADDLPRLGRVPFQRGAGKAATYSGMGIGLYLSRLVAEGHGGSLHLASEGEDRGSVVRITMPLTPPS